MVIAQFRNRSLTGMLLLPLFLAACGNDSRTSDSCLGDAACIGTPMIYDFSEGKQGWEAGFADYPEGAEQLYELQSRVASLPPELGLSQTGYLVSGINHSDDLFMYLTRCVNGLETSGCYQLDYQIEFATNAPSDCVGVGGAPGEHVTLKAGAADRLPAAATDENGFYSMNIDKGNQGQGGKDAPALGHIGNTRPCPSEVYELKTLRGSHRALANADGELWFIVGTDSGFEGRTSLYYRRIAVMLTPCASG